MMNVEINLGETYVVRAGISGNGFLGIIYVGHDREKAKSFNKLVECLDEETKSLLDGDDMEEVELVMETWKDGEKILETEIPIDFLP